METTLHLNPTQSTVFEAIFDEGGQIRRDCPTEVAIFGGFRAGKSLLVMLIVHLICAEYPGVKWLFSRATYQELEDSCIPQYLQLFPPELCGYRFLKADREAIYENGSGIHFRAFDKDHKILSNEYDSAAFCQAEEIPEQLFLMSLGRLSGSRMPVNMVLCEGNPANTWPKKRYRDRFAMKKLPKETLFLEVPTFENEKNLPKDYIQRLLAEYPKQWIDRYVYGGWDSIDEMVFNEYRPSKHNIVGFEIPKFWNIIVGFDHGVKNPSAILFIAVDTDGRLYIFDEFYGTAGVEEYGAITRRHGKRTVVIDSSTKAKDRDGGSLFDDLIKLGVIAIPANKDKMANIELINMLFRQDRLFIFTSCENTIRDFSNYRWKKLALGADKNLPEEVVKRDDHACDSAMYAIRYLKDTKSIEPNKLTEDKTMLYKVIRSKRSGNDGPVQESTIFA